LFKVRASNLYGDGDLSTAFSIDASQGPDQPIAVVTADSGINVVLTWTAPSDNQDALTGYIVKIL